MLMKCVGVSARGHVSGIPFRTVNRSLPRSDVSMAVWSTSPSPCTAWPSPTSNSAPRTNTGMYSVVPATSALLSMFPACLPGGVLLTRPRSGDGATPMLPKNGWSGTTMPGANVEVIAFRSSGRMRIPALRSQFSRTNPLQPL